MSISTAGNKILSFYHEALALNRGEMVVPRMVSLWLTSACDLNCHYCYYRHEKSRFADTSKVKKLIDDFSKLGVESLEFSGGGEPGLHADCYSLAEYAVSRGLRVGILTNGSRIDIDRAMCFDYIRIGLDAYCDDKYQTMKGALPGRFTKTLKIIQQLLAARTNIQPRIGLKFMINQSNMEDIAAMILLSQNIGVDYCHFKPTHNDESSLTKTESAAAELELRFWQSNYPNFIYGSFVHHPAVVKCWLSPIHTVVTETGNVLVCCYFFQDQDVIGNAFNDGFEDVWFSSRHSDIIANIGTDRCSTVDCRWNHYNAEMEDVIHRHKHDLSFI